MMEVKSAIILEKRWEVYLLKVILYASDPLVLDKFLCDLGQPNFSPLPSP